MKYVMSDIHGCYDDFIKMLKLISFNSNDELYIIGDIFDRGDNPINILDYIVTHKNITLLKGNHELMFTEAFENNDYSLWYSNGGSTTHNQLMKRDFLYEESVYKYIKKLPFIKVIDKFILVHAYLYLPDNYNDLSIDEIISMQTEDNCLWDRSNIGKEKQYKDYKIIYGHTPVQAFSNGNKILNIKNNYYIDCGCCFKNADGKLSCLRLDDMKEFYV